MKKQLAITNYLIRSTWIAQAILCGIFVLIASLTLILLKKESQFIAVLLTLAVALSSVCCVYNYSTANKKSLGTLNFKMYSSKYGTYLAHYGVMVLYAILLWALFIFVSYIFMDAKALPLLLYNGSAFPYLIPNNVLALFFMFTLLFVMPSLALGVYLTLSHKYYARMVCIIALTAAYIFTFIYVYIQLTVFIIIIENVIFALSVAIGLSVCGKGAKND